MFDPSQDQAAGLRRLFKQPVSRLLPVLGAGPDGRARGVVDGLAAAFARGGSRILVVDGHRAGGPVASAEPEALAQEGRGRGRQGGVRRLALPASIADRAEDPAAAGASFQELLGRHHGFDLTLLDAPEEIVGALLSQRGAEALVICGPDREDLTGAYARVKRLARSHGLTRFRVLFTEMRDPGLAFRRHRMLSCVAARYLAVEIGYGGALSLPKAGPASPADAPPAHAFAPIVANARHWQLAAIGPMEPAFH